jgi:hypothetical protein
MGLILFAKKFIDFVYDGNKDGIEFAEGELERQELGEQKDGIVELVYSLYKQGLSKEEAIQYILS